MTGPPEEPPGPASLQQARDTGADTVYSIRRGLARAAAQLIRRDPEAAHLAAEMGLVDPLWLQRPDERPLVATPALEVVERFLERSVEQRPSRLSSLSLSALQLLASRASPAHAGSEPATVVFTDLEGFTAYTDRHGDDDALQLLQDHYRAAGPVVRHWQGRIVKHLGDGLLCVFKQPEAGVLAALDLLGTAPDPLRLRAGIHHGDALVSRSDVIGQVVNVSARVAEQAAGGQVLVTGEIADTVGRSDHVVFHRRGRRRLRGIEDRFELYEAVAAATAN
ncbi:MAG: adenylate/guanylate cyclase domain-containing protein [Acidimicrobiales bacterium]